MQRLLLITMLVLVAIFLTIELKEKTPCWTRMKGIRAEMDVIESTALTPSSLLGRRTQDGQCIDHTFEDGKEWTAIDRTSFNCAFFADDNRCKKWWSWYYKNEAHNAKSACCACGGGSTLLETSYHLFPMPVTSTPARKPTKAPVQPSPTKAPTFLFPAPVKSTPTRNPTKAPIQSFSSRTKEPSSLALNEEEQAWLDEHNERRQKYHDMYERSYVPLKWNKILAKTAKEFAKELSINCDLSHDKEFDGGENLAWSWGSENDIHDVLYRWTEKEHDGNSEKIGIVEASNSKDAGNMDAFSHGHFSQVVWRSTTELGCGHASNLGKKCTIQVCRYSKPGNCNLFCNQNTCDNNNIPSKRWQGVVFGDNNSCSISQKWWDENKD
mmetsp:Transcript_4950/g.7069  ORF Transcript_4950/g.7069 Transcript_4950/m.7069 type:complete len:382 (-) Transcript_4950:401-1546(-)